MPQPSIGNTGVNDSYRPLNRLRKMSLAQVRTEYEQKKTVFLVLRGKVVVMKLHMHMPFSINR
jgi:hypothetical protein